MVSNLKLDFYNIKEHLSHSSSIENILSNLEIDELIEMILCIEPLFKHDTRKAFISGVSQALKESIEEYCNYIEAENYDVDISDALSRSTCYYDEYGSDIDRDEAKRLIEDEIEALIIDEINEKLEKLPSDIIVLKEFTKNISLNIFDIEAMIDSYLESDGVDYDDSHHGNHNTESSEIDFMFNR